MKNANRRSFWERVVAEVEAGSRVATVAQRYGVNPGTLKWWRSRLRCEAARRPAEPALLPVVVRQEQGAPGHILEVLIRDVVVRVTAGTDPVYVAALAGALREC